jgi:hypothetical protein
VWIAPRSIPRGGYVDYYPGYWSTPEYVQNYVPNYGEMQLQIGASMQGMLQYGDRVLPNGALANDFVVSLSPGQTITIAAHGGPSWTTPGGRLDPMVQVLSYSGPSADYGNQYGQQYGQPQATANEFVYAQDDDSAGSQDSLLVFTPVRGGTYRIRVTSYGGGMNQGYYTLNSRFGVQLGGL